MRWYTIFCYCMYDCSWLYWCDNLRDTIERASMDGTSRSVIISTSLSNPMAITIDYDSQTLFWADSSYRKIESSSTDGSNRTLVTTSNVLTPTDMTFFQGKLYWLDDYYDRVYSVSLESPNSATLIRSSIGSYAYGIAIVSEERQPEGW